MSAAALSTLLWSPRPLLVWNASPSSPIGLYLVTPAEDMRAGEMVIAWPPPRARRIAVQRGYLPANVPLVKQVAAARGDRVCAAGEALFVNGRFLALRRTQDAAGRKLPWWNGCRKLQNGELFLLMRGARDSYDGRYFGPIQPPQAVGRARLTWAG